MVQEFGLSTPPLERLATMVRAADTARLNLSRGTGLLAASLGLSRIQHDDLEQLSAGVLLYDACLAGVGTRQRNPRLANEQGEAVEESR